MASKTFSGQLDQAIDELAAEGNKILFIPQQNVGEVLEGAASEMTVASDGTYSIKLAYNTYSIYHYSDVTKRKRLLADGIVVSSETSVTTIPGLIGSTVPVTEDGVLAIQGYLDEANEAKTDAETARAATEALYDDFDSNVAGAMALVHTETPSLSAPFNESGRLDYGIGTEYVSGLPIYGVDFTRSTSCYYINKSGLIDYADVDEIAVASGGAYLHGSVVGNFTYNTQFDTSGGWTINNGTASTDGTESPSVSGYLWDTYKYIPSGTENYHTLYKTISSGREGDYTFRVIFKPDGYGFFGGTLRTEDNANYFYFDTITGEFGINFTDSGELDVDKMQYKRLSNGWILISVVVNFATLTTEDKRVQFGPQETSDYVTYSGDGTSGIYIAWADISEGNLLSGAPLTISTSSSASTITATSCTVPVSGNLPAAGESFTIVCDAAVPNSKSAVWSIADVNFVLWRFNEDGVVQLRVSDNTTTKTPTVSSSTDGSFQRYAITYDAVLSTVSTYADGVMTISEDVSDIDWSLTPLSTGSNLILGGPAQSSYLNSQIKNFKILPYAASADEVKSWGAPK